MRIVHFTSVHEHNDMRAFIVMCKSLARAGHEVHYVVPRADTTEVEHRDGVSIHPVLPAKNRFQRMTSTVQYVLRAAAALDGDIYHFHDPEFLIAAPKWQKKLNKPFVYDVHEDYRVKMREKSWLPAFTRKPAEWIFGQVEDYAAKQLAGIVVANPATVKRFLRHPAVITALNYPLMEEIAVVVKDVKKVPGLFVYIGVIAHLRGAVEMVKAIDLAGLQAMLALAGPLSPVTLRDELAHLKGWGQVHARGFLNRADVAGLLAQAVAGLAILHPTPAYLEAYPTKLFEYMSAGIPVIISDIPLYRELVDAIGCALFVDPLSPSAIAKAMCWLMEHPSEAAEMGRRGRLAVLEKYNWEAELPKLLKFYNDIKAGWPALQKEH